MATGGRSVEESWGDDFRHTCTLCMEPYRGRHPKLLPCFHTFCLPCLTTLAATASATVSTTTSTNDKNSKTGEERDDSMTDQKKAVLATEKEVKKDGHAADSQEGESKSDLGTENNGGAESAAAVFLCPTCRAPVTIPEGGVDSLQTNFYLDTEDTNTAAPSGPVLCDMCEEGEKQDATHYCTKCRQNMCRACRRMHDKFTDASTHRVQPVKSTKKQRLAKKTPTACPVHPDHSLCLHCVKCDVNICMLCKLTSHDGHSTEDMAAANLRAMEELKGLLVKASEQVQVAEAHLCHLDRDERELLRQKQEVTRELHTRFEKAMATMSRARDEVMDELVSREQTASSKIRAEKLSARNTLETLTNLLTRARHEADIVALKNEVQAALLTDDAVDSCRRVSAAEQDRFFVYQADIADLEKEMVQAYMGKLQDPMIMGTSVNAKMVSFCELTTAVVDLKTSLAKVTSDLTTRVESGNKKLSEVETQLIEVENGAKAELEKLTTTVSRVVSGLNSKIQKSAQRVSFNVYLEYIWEPSDEEVIIFTGVHDNDGGCYDTTTGIFTCPCDGTYVFHTTVQEAGSGQSAETVLKINGYGLAHACGTDTCSGTASVSADLKANDKVFVEHYEGGYLHFNRTIFSGTLVQAKV